MISLFLIVIECHGMDVVSTNFYMMRISSRRVSNRSTCVAPKYTWRRIEFLCRTMVYGKFGALPLVVCQLARIVKDQ